MGKDKFQLETSVPSAEDAVEDVSLEKKAKAFKLVAVGRQQDLMKNALNSENSKRREFRVAASTRLESIGLPKRCMGELVRRDGTGFEIAGSIEQPASACHIDRSNS